MLVVLEILKIYFFNVFYFFVGYSVGGQLLGLMYNVYDFIVFCNFGSFLGSLRNMCKSYLLKVYFFMNFYIFVSNLLFGYIKFQWVGMGELLFKKVVCQW